MLGMQLLLKENTKNGKIQYKGQASFDTLETTESTEVS